MHRPAAGHARLRRPCPRRWKWARAICGSLALVTLAPVSGLAGAVAAPDAVMPAQLRAHAARALRAKDTAHLHFVSAKGSLLLDEGQATGTLPGRMKARVRIGATFSGSFTFYTATGAIYGHGSATPHGAGQYESFAGFIVATGGTGRYRNAHGRAQLYGVFNRRDYSFVIQTAGTLYY